MTSRLRQANRWHLHETGETVLYPWFNLIALPFTPSSHPYDPGKIVEDAGKGIAQKGGQYPIVVLSHLAFPGVQPGEETMEMPRGREVLFPLREVGLLRQLNPLKIVVIQGHYHRAQTLHHEGFDVHIPGSVARLTFGEEEHKPSFLVLDL